MEDKPRITIELLDYLRRTYQPRISAQLSIDDYRRQEGHQDVLGHLEALYKMQKG